MGALCERIVTAVLLIAAGMANAQDGAFAKLDFGGEVRIEVPRNWTFLDDNIKKHLNTGGEAAARLAGIAPNPGENVILVAANAFTSLRTPSATLRLSVRRGESPSQSEMREVAKPFPKTPVTVLGPVLGH